MSDSIVPVVSLVNDVPMVSSLDVAEKFEKKHQHVLEAIRKLLDELPDEFGQSNFRQTTYTDTQGREQICYNLTRDAFSLLAMGFTGKKALAWKVKYIEAFNAMEAALAGKAERKPSPAAPTEINSVQDLYALRRAQYQGLPEKEKARVEWRIDKRLRDYFGTSCLSEIPHEQWQKAAKLITVPFQKQGSFGLVRKMGQTPMAQTVRPVLMPEAVPASLQEVLDTLEDIRKKCEQCLHVIYRYKGSDYTDCRYNMLTRLKLHSFEALDLAKNMIITLGHFSRA